MGRVNKTVKPIFSGITPEALEDFHQADKDLIEKDYPSVINLRKNYNKILKSISDEIRKLSLYEKLIIQLRCFANLKNTMTLYVNKNKVGSYVYARSLFYTGCDDLKEIRVFIGKVEDIGTSDVVLLRDNKDFMKTCFNKLSHEMCLQIGNTEKELFGHNEKQNVEDEVLTK